uniref:Uncharacterized protein n=1 Tax=Cannabis sativa TaxID=3483 RepID=A0A803NUJ4_CANSA
MEKTSKELLHLEEENSSIDVPIKSTLLICKKAQLTSQFNKTNPPGKPITAPLPPSQVLGKVKDFLGVLSEANKKLQVDAKDNIANYDIEVLSGNESQIIEMDLMLGVADLHTPEAVAAAESAIAAGRQPVESDDNNDEKSSAKDNSSKEVGKTKSNRQSKIIDMDICK